MKKNTIVGFIFFLMSFTLLADFIRLDKLQSSLIDIKEVVETELKQGEIYETKQFGKISYICQQNCAYNDGEIVRYELILKESFILTLGQKEIKKSCYFYLDKSNS